VPGAAGRLSGFNAYNSGTSVSQPTDRRSFIDPPLSDGDRRALRLLLYLALAAVGFVVLSFVASIALFFSDVAAIFFLAWLLAFLLDPFASWLVRVSPAGALPRGVAVLLVYLLIAVLLLVVAVVIADSLAGSITQFVNAAPRLREDLPTVLAPIQTVLDDIGLGQFKLADGAIGILDSFNQGSFEVLQPIQQIAAFGVNAFGTFSLILFLSVYMAADGARLRVGFHRLFPARFEANLAVFENSVARSFGGFVRGQVLLGVLYGAIAFVTCVVLGLPYLPLVVGIVTVIHMVPFFGPFVSWTPPVIVAVLFAPAALVPALLIMGVSMLLLMNLVQPRIMGDAVGLHPIAVLGSVLIGAKLFGVLGAIFAVPVAAVLAAIVIQWRHRSVEAPATPEQMAAAARAAEASAVAVASAAAAARNSGNGADGPTSSTRAAGPGTLRRRLGRRPTAGRQAS
jgi:predicted PurR-regulated permease PerM